MSSPSLPSLHPAELPPGTQVGPWRVVGWAGRGVHGLVYRAERIGQEHLPPVALKVAVLPEDPRFERERELLSRSLHPHIPQLVDHGYWESPRGARHPFLALEWVDGLPLYEWAHVFHPSAAQLLRLLAQAALALQHLHAHGGLHRDFKGDNLLVRRSDSRLFLVDFGSGLYPEADRLTPPLLLPGTPAYRAPEAWLFASQPHLASERYPAGPAEDVFALGVTACVLFAGGYPELGTPRQGLQGQLLMDSLKVPRALFSAKVAPPVRELIMRMLALGPEERPTAAELAPALERAADALRPFHASALAPAPEPVRREPWAARSAGPGPMWHTWLAGMVAAGALGLWVGGLIRPVVLPASELPPQSAPAAHSHDMLRSPETKTAGLGEAPDSIPLEQVPPAGSERALAESLPELSEGQAQPDKKGRCPHPQQVVLNGGCWVRVKVSRAECDAFGEGQMYQQACYVPVFPGKRERPSTSGEGRPWPK